MNRRAIIFVAGVAAVSAAVAAGFSILRRPPAPAAAVAAPSRQPPASPAPATESKPGTPTALRTPMRSAPKREAPIPEPVVEAPKVATLRIESDVPGASVFINRKFIGAAPVTAENITPGTYQLNVSAPGYDGIAETIDVVPGPRDILIKLKEIRLDASVDVTHKHGVGNCAGRLVATVAGIKYETTHQEDGFSVGLLDLEVFEVNFLEKNLRVKLKAGKTYNFTDPTGKADRLYLFHQEVEKARDRLRKQ